MTIMRSRSSLSCKALAAALTLMLSLPATGHADERLKFDIGVQPLVQALKAFAEQANMQLLYKHEVVEHASANAVVGSFDRRSALEQLLRGTGLEIVFTADDAATIRPRSHGDSPRGAATIQSKDPGPIRLAQAETLLPAQAEGRREEDGKEAASLRTIELEEIVVTGSHIRGVQGGASPSYSFGREDIVRSGATSVQQFMRTLPQNFQGGATETGATLNYGRNNGGHNLGLGAGINLRGLGSASTLVLLNGRRLPPGGLGSMVDVSTIPLSVLERVDVVPDGASAIYGSDAVGGVVNFVLRDNFEGAETAVRYGGVTSGSLRELNAHALGGTVWDSGSLLVNLDYGQRDPLLASERSFTAPLQPGRGDLHQSRR